MFRGGGFFCVSKCCRLLFCDFDKQFVLGLLVWLSSSVTLSKFTSMRLIYCLTDDISENSINGII